MFLYGPHCSGTVKFACDDDESTMLSVFRLAVSLRGARCPVVCVNSTNQRHSNNGGQLQAVCKAVAGWQFTSNLC